MRVAVQVASLALFTLLFALANYRLPDWLPADIYLRLDPLLGLSAIVAEAKKLQLDFQPDPGDDRFILMSEGLRAEPGKQEGAELQAKPPAAPSTNKNKKPKGFLP